MNMRCRKSLVYAGKCAAILALILLTHTTQAHSIRAAYLELVESAPGRASGAWKVPLRSSPAWPHVEGCNIEAAHTASKITTPTTKRFIYPIVVTCPERLAGRQLTITGLGGGVDEAVVRILLENGDAASQVLRPSRHEWKIPANENFMETIYRFVGLGFVHILEGPDHLLFISGLLILIGADRFRRLLLTISSFTLAHSLTLGATALGWLHINPQAAEALIALTLVLLALQAMKSLSSQELSKEGPWIAFVFGLVHGLGFAGALRDIGLPEHALLSGLFGFNVGVEVGQCTFILFLIGIEKGIVRRMAKNEEKASWLWRKGGAYLVGGFGFFWLLNRLP